MTHFLPSLMDHISVISEKGNFESLKALQQPNKPRGPCTLQGPIAKFLMLFGAAIGFIYNIMHGISIVHGYR